MRKVGFAPAWVNSQLLLAHLGMPSWRPRATGHACIRTIKVGGNPVVCPRPCWGKLSQDLGPYFSPPEVSRGVDERREGSSVQG